MEKRFTKLEHDAWGGFLTSYGIMNAKIDKDLREKFDISHVEFEVLLRLYWSSENRMRIQDLSSESILSISGVSRMVDRLDKTKWLTKVLAKEDRRASYAVLTKRGKTRFEKVMDDHIALVKDEFLSAYTPEDLKSLSHLWKKFQLNQT